MSYNTKNYTEQGGEVTHIGGTLQFDEGAGFSGFPGAENQAAGTSTTAASIRADLNALLIKLKNAGIMIPDTWNVSAALAPTPTDETVVANNELVDSVSIENGVITVAVDVDKLTPSESSAPGQGTHKWVALSIGTGLSAITDAEYNDVTLTAEDVSEATACGCDAGAFVLYIKAEVVATEGKTFTLNADGYAKTTFAVEVIPPTPAN